MPCSLIILQHINVVRVTTKAWFCHLSGEVSWDKGRLTSQPAFGFVLGTGHLVWNIHFPLRPHPPSGPWTRSRMHQHS